MKARHDTFEGAHRGRSLRGERTSIRQIGDGARDGRMHPPRPSQEEAEVGRDDVGAVHDPAERGCVDRLGVGALAHLRQLLRITEEEQAG